MLIDRKPNKILVVLGQIWQQGLMLAVLSAMVGQCTSNSLTLQKVQQINDRDAIFQVGAGREIFVGKKITEAENREQFIAELFSSISWTKQTSAQYQERCKVIAKEVKNRTLFKQCQSGLDPGAVTEWGKVSSQIYAYQYLIAPESLNGMMKFIVGLKPKGYDSPSSRDSRTFKVTRLGAAEPFKKGKNGLEMRTPVELETTENQGSIVTRKYKGYYWVYTREIVGPSKNGAKTPYSEAVEATQRRGLYLTRILPYSDSNF
jgi:hypothetical protein